MNELINKAIEAFHDNCEKVPTRDILSKVLTAALTICKTAGNSDVWDSLSESEKEGAVLFVCRDICRSFSDPATMA